MEIQTTLIDLVRNRDKYKQVNGHLYHSFIFNGEEFSDIFREFEDRVFCQTMNPYGSKQLRPHCKITIIHRPISQPVERQKTETFEQLVARIAPKQYTGLAGRTHDNEKTNQTIHGQASS